MHLCWIIELAMLDVEINNHITSAGVDKFKLQMPDCSEKESDPLEERRGQNSFRIGSKSLAMV